MPKGAEEGCEAKRYYDANATHKTRRVSRTAARSTTIVSLPTMTARVSRVPLYLLDD